MSNKTLIELNYSINHYASRYPKCIIIKINEINSDVLHCMGCDP